ncbi:hypothetical protein BCR36DRAFT_580522 [Piromyces finnis]|uniref:PH domain-containing protein n=1 Tax=Piromyces finnis TaxID=1754191 RepID=A0A1Y1VI80_9FUNG|nr:hypothetical protein BCR36DRAFT_580522 [Piromyces finnis]|eukprot:ORX57104.1 hypothetical protein BCR36DRAFT_580522 [Piromyces finnis]
MNSNVYLSSNSVASNINSEYMNFTNKDFEFFPRILHIPNSITCQNDFSWGFWNWIHSLDNVYQDNVVHDKSPSDEETLLYTKVFTPDGTSFQLNPSYKHHTKHLHIERNNIPTPKSEAIINKRNALNNYVNQHNEMEGISEQNRSSAQKFNSTMVPRFYIQVMNFKGENFKNVSSICCSIEIDNKKVFTSIANCHKNSDGTVTAKFNEAFVFDVASNEFSIVISVYGLYHKTINKSFVSNIKKTLNIKNEKSSIRPSFTGVFRNYHINNDELCALTTSSINGPKNSTLTKSISIISNTFSLKKTKKESTKNPMDNIDLMGKEIYIGDYEINFTSQKLDKTTGTYILKQQALPTKQNTISSKNIQQSIIIQTGIYWDEKVKQSISYINENIYCDYLSVQLSTTTVPVWKRYWVIFKENILTFYDFEYKEKKEPIGKIDIHTLKSIGLPNPEYNSMPNCFCIEFEEGKDLADIVGVFQKEGDYNEEVVEEDTENKKYARIKPKEELLLKKEIKLDANENNSNVNSNNTLYSSKKENLNDSIIEEEEQISSKDNAEINGEKNETTEEKKEGNSLDNVAINMESIETIMKNISLDINKESNEAVNSNNTLHQQNQEKIPYYEWINRVVTKSSAYFYTDSYPKLNQWMKTIEESPCFQISK